MKGAARSFSWTIAQGQHMETFECEPEQEPCPLCGKQAVVELPAPLKLQQPDETTHVCHPALDGCNHGFQRDAS